MLWNDSKLIWAEPGDAEKNTGHAGSKKLFANISVISTANKSSVDG